MTTTDPEQDPESEELRTFREQWRAEVLKKRIAEQQQKAAPDSEASAADRSRVPTSPGVHIGSSGASATETPFQAKKRRALEAYRRAVTCEQSSNLDEALKLYRQAFKLDPDVDMAFMRTEGLITRTGSSTAPKAAPASQNSGTHEKKTPLDGITSKVQAIGLASARPQHHYSEVTPLASTLRRFAHVLHFAPEDEREPVHIHTLPDELLVYILRYLDARSLERFACICQKARIISLDGSIWRPFVQSIYKPPQIADDESVEGLLPQYGADLRRMYIEHPRVRLDGVYIAVNQYIRNGQSENVWVNVSHLVTYHRYLRFYPDGQVISLLANEDHEPQEIVTMLKPSLRMKGLFIGTWRLVGTTVYVTELADPSEPNARYTFQMILQLRSRPLGRWNKLDFTEYDSVSSGSGEAIPLPLKRERPFWFSKVRSYA